MYLLQSFICMFSLNFIMYEEICLNFLAITITLLLLYQAYHYDFRDCSKKNVVYIEPTNLQVSGLWVFLCMWDNPNFLYHSE